MGFFSRLFEAGKRGEPPAMPWDQRPSIYDHIRSHVPADGPGLTEGGETLPDEERVNAGSKIRWAAGAMDGVLSHHMGQIATWLSLLYRRGDKRTGRSR
jgi:hypothetical protein